MDPSAACACACHRRKPPFSEAELALSQPELLTVKREGCLAPSAGGEVEVWCRTYGAWYPGQCAAAEDGGAVQVEFYAGSLLHRKRLRASSDQLRAAVGGAFSRGAHGPSEGAPARAHSCRCSRSAEESSRLGVSVTCLATRFLQEVEEKLGHGADPDYYAVDGVMLHGPRARGFGLICPRDGLPDCSYVDALDCRLTGRADVMLSWTWSSTTQQVVSSVQQWCERSGRDPERTYVWQCALCINQFRIQSLRARGKVESFETFRDTFASRLHATGHVLAVLSPWDRPAYTQRAWCVFELWSALEAGCKLDTVLPISEEEGFLDAFQHGGLWRVWEAFKELSVQGAQTSVPADRERILHLVDPGALSEVAIWASRRCAELNHKVVEHIQAWFVGAVAAAAEARLAVGVPIPPMTCRHLADLAAQAGAYDQVEGLLRRSLALREAQDAQGAGLLELASLADVLNWGCSSAPSRSAEKSQEAAALYRRVEDAREARGLGFSWSLAASVAILLRRLKRYEEVVAYDARAAQALEAGPPDGAEEGAWRVSIARVLLNVGAVRYQQLGDLGGAAGTFARCDALLTSAQATVTPAYAALKLHCARLADAGGRQPEADRLLAEAQRIFERTGASGHPSFKELQSYIEERRAPALQLLGQA